MPSFWLGLMLIVLFSGEARLAAAGRLRGTSAPGYGLRPRARHRHAHLVLPMLSAGADLPRDLSAADAGLDAGGDDLDFVRTARAKGLSEGEVLSGGMCCATRCCRWSPLGLQFGTMLGGASWSRAFLAARPRPAGLRERGAARSQHPARHRVGLRACWSSCVNFLVDLLYARLDPRIGGERMRPSVGPICAARRAGVIGRLLLLAVLVVAALSADLVFPRDPLALAGRPLQWPGRQSAAAGSAPTISAADIAGRSSSMARASRC